MTIPSVLGIAAYQSAYAFAFVQCLMNLVIAANRFVAVCFPLYYKFPDTLKVYSSPVFPCNHLGYSPRSYTNVFVKCRADLERDYSFVTKYVISLCLTIACLSAGALNFTTFCRIVVIRLVSSILILKVTLDLQSSVDTFNDKEFRRAVRLFTLDILMTIVGIAITICGNGQKLNVVGILLNTDGLIFIYAFNTMSSLPFNNIDQDHFNCFIILHKQSSRRNLGYVEVDLEAYGSAKVVFNL
uniref:7TM_GPCR_Srx domain-containing protein n=1 Tax=Steinernema glaseri TaxID=37863 RepID=A0A1I7YJR2_9BILA